MQTDAEEWVWKTAFSKSYDPDSFHDWWSAKDNLLIQKEGGIFQMLVTPPDNTGQGENVDFLLYHPGRQIKQIAYNGSSGSTPRLVSIDLRQKLEKYAIFSAPYKGYVSWGFKLVSSASNLLSVAKMIYDDYKSTDMPTDYLIVDLSKMILQDELERKQRPFSNFDFDRRGYLFLYVDEPDESELVELLASIVYAPTKKRALFRLFIIIVKS